MRKTKIIHFHFNTAPNKGDEAIVMGIKQLLKKELKNMEYKSMDLTHLNLYPKIFNKLVDRLRLFISDETLNNSSIYKILCKLFIQLKSKNKQATLKSIQAHDLVVIGGGGLYSRWGLPIDTKLITKITKPIVIFGAGFNQHLGENPLDSTQLNSAKILHETATVSSVRDYNTKDFLIKMGKKPILIGDPAIFLKNKKTTQTFHSNKIKIGLNIASHKWKKQKSTLDRILHSYQKFISSIQLKEDVQLFYLQHSPKEDIIIDFLSKHFPAITVINTSPSKLKYTYEQMDITIGMMLHSSILSFGSNTPFINIPYDNKNKAFAETIDYQQGLLPIDELTEITLEKQFYKTLNNKEEIKKNFLKQYLKLQEKTDTFLSKINEPL